MRFEVSPPNRPTRIAAGLVTLCFGIGVAAIPSILSVLGGVGLFVTGLCVVCANVYTGMQEWLRRRSDPYDLSRLWDAPLPEEEDPAAVHSATGPNDLLYCHHCGASMSQRHAICPECGNRLGA